MGARRRLAALGILFVAAAFTPELLHAAPLAPGPEPPLRADTLPAPLLGVLALLLLASGAWMARRALPR